MRRRRVLGLLGAGTVSALAGCTVGYQGRSAPASTAPMAGEVPPDELVRGASKDGIPAIVDPVFGRDWSGIEYPAHHPIAGEYTARPRLADTDLVVGVERGGEARAYPLLVLTWHEIVNDTFDGPLLVTYCPLCGSAVVAERLVDGHETVFGVSGLLYNNDLVMYDRATESLWSQIEARAIRGPKTGTHLTLVPSSLTTWGAWRAEHPDTVVLRPPPESNTVSGPRATRNYDINPYPGYSTTNQIGIGGSYDDPRLHPKTTVIGIVHDGTAKAYPFERVDRTTVVNDAVGGRPIVVTVTDDGTLVAYDRTVAGRTLQFTMTSGLLVGGETRWNPLTGQAVAGLYDGERLTPATNLSPMYFFAWRSFYPDTSVYGDAGGSQ